MFNYRVSPRMTLMSKDYSVEVMIWVLGGTALALGVATAVSILFSLW
jgi:hypothetical protein